MEAKARQTNIKMTARKLRRVINEVRGKAAAANAFEKGGVKADALKVSEIYADESVTYKRGKPRAQGRIYRRLKRTSHLTIKVSDAVK